MPFRSELAAYSWLKDKMWYLHGPQPVEMYIKGEFDGILFVKLESNEDRDAAVRVLRSNTNGNNSGVGGEYDDADYWAKSDMALPQRTVHSFVFGAKAAMVEWGWPKRALWADPVSGTLSLAKKEVLTAAVVNEKVTITYSEGWQTYCENPNFPQIKELIHTANEKMAKGAGKGKDKGSKGATLGY